MKLSEAIELTAESFCHSTGLPSHCDVRCALNDMTATNNRISNNGYNQDRAYKAVIKKIKQIKIER